MLEAKARVSFRFAPVIDKSCKPLVISNREIIKGVAIVLGTLIKVNTLDTIFAKKSITP